MHPHGGVRAVQIAVVAVIVHTREGLLRRLEQKLHGALKLRPLLPQKLRRAQKHGRVAVVAAGVHHARVNTLKLHAAVLLDGKSVDIRPEHHGAPRRSALDGGDAARIVVKGLHRDPQLLKTPHQIGRGLVLLKGELGVTV